MASPLANYTTSVAATRTKSVENVLSWPSQPQRSKPDTSALNPRRIKIPIGEIADLVVLVAFLFLLCMVRA